MALDRIRTHLLKEYRVVGECPRIHRVTSPCDGASVLSTEEGARWSARLLKDGQQTQNTTPGVKHSPFDEDLVKMSKLLMLRAFVNERLAAAVEDIAALFERRTVEYEEELRLSEDENQRKQRLLEQLLNPKVLLFRVDTGPSLKQEITHTPHIKEEPLKLSVTQEEEQLQETIPESSVVYVKTEEASFPQRGESVPQEQIQDENSSSETDEQTELSLDSDNDEEDWEPLFRSQGAQIDTDAEEDNHTQVQSRNKRTKLSPENKSLPEQSATVHKVDMSTTDRAAKRKKHQCSVCQKTFAGKGDLKRHIRIHTKEKPYSCSVCDKSFARKYHLVVHRRTHTGEKPYSCTVCEKAFAQRCNLKSHMSTHSI